MCDTNESLGNGSYRLPSARVVLPLPVWLYSAVLLSCRLYFLIIIIRLSFKEYSHRVMALCLCIMELHINTVHGYIMYFVFFFWVA